MSNRAGVIVATVLGVCGVLTGCESVPRGGVPGSVARSAVEEPVGSRAFRLGTVRRTETYAASSGETESAIHLQYQVRPTRLTPDSTEVVRGEVVWLEGRDELGAVVFDLVGGSDSVRRRLDATLPLPRAPMGVDLDAVGRGAGTNVRARIVSALPDRVELVGEVAFPVYSGIERRDVTLEELGAGVRVAPNLYIGGVAGSDAPALGRRYRAELLIPAAAERAYWALEPVETTLLLSLDAIAADGAVLGEIPGMGGSSGKSRVRREFTLSRVEAPAGSEVGGVRVTYARRLEWRVEEFEVKGVPLRGVE